MKKKTFDYIMWRTSIWIIVMFAIIPAIHAQTETSSQNSRTPHKVKMMSQQERLKQRKKDAAKNDTLRFPLFNGIYVGADMLGPANHFFGSKYESFEVSGDVNLRNRFFPVLEIGMGKSDNSKNAITYHSGRAPYFRIGMNYKMKYKSRSESHLFVGFRYGFTKFKYDVNSSGITDGIWGGTIPLSVNNESSNASWYELVTGIRVQIYKNLMMGWTVRYGTKISVKSSKNANPWYVPGFGQNRNNNYVITYSLYYKLPF